VGFFWCILRSERGTKGFATIVVGMRAVLVDLTEGHLLGVEKPGLVFSFFLSAATAAVTLGAATAIAPEPERDLD
jgi:hypothetical protein